MNCKYLVAAILAAGVSQAAVPSSTLSPTAQRPLLDKYCVTCHNDKLKTGGLTLQSADLAKVPENAELWEKVIRKVRVEAMPPMGMPKPDDAARAAFVASLESTIDQAAALH